MKYFLVFFLLFTPVSDAYYKFSSGGRDFFYVLEDVGAGCSDFYLFRGLSVGEAKAACKKAGFVYVSVSYYECFFVEDGVERFVGVLCADPSILSLMPDFISAVESLGFDSSYEFLTLYFFDITPDQYFDALSSGSGAFAFSEVEPFFWKINSFLVYIFVSVSLFLGVLLFVAFKQI
ncbi:MAG: hypothetical protein Q4D38_05145 [Planctomycetia bacterium]|nr:hypothetical protein [Planctomycetia bacterium]